MSFDPPLGRVQLTEHQWAEASAAMPGMAPVGDTSYPQKSYSRLARFRWPRFHAQYGLGQCTGCAVAELAEQLARLTDPLGSPPNPKQNTPQFSSQWPYFLGRDRARKAGRPIAGEGAVVLDVFAAVMAEGLIEDKFWPNTPETAKGYRDVAPTLALTAPRWRVTGERITSVDQLLYVIGVKQKPVCIGMGWRGGYETGTGGGHTWDGRSVGGHAFVTDWYDLTIPQPRIGTICWWDEGGFGVRAEKGSVDSFGNPLPWGYSWTLFNDWRKDVTQAAFSSGEIEAFYLDSIIPPTADPQPKPDPTPPQPTPPPTPPPNPPPAPGPATPGVPTSWSGHVIAADGRLYEVTQTVKRLT